MYETKGERRERKRQKAKNSMRVRGRSTKTLLQTLAQRSPVRKKKKP